MSAAAPTEVLLVAEKVPLWRGLITGQLFVWLSALIGGYTLMLLIPLARETFGLSVPAPGYWRCVALIALTRVTFRFTFGRVLPVASQRRPS